MSDEYLELPERLYYEDFGGDILAFIDAAYNVFQKDFIISRPLFNGRPLALKKYPLINDKEYTFYHLTQEGSDESEREFSINRTECITFPRPLIDNITHPYLKVWHNKRNGRERVLIYHENEEYLVVLDVREKYALLWTAYPIEREHTKNKLMKEYEEYIKSKDR